jgi:hypothetical protein
MDEALKSFYNEKDLKPKDNYERKWNIVTKFKIDDFKRHVQDYI